MTDEINAKTTLLELLDHGCDIIMPDDDYRIGRHGGQLYWLEGRTLYRNRGEVTPENVQRLLTDVRLAQEDRDMRREDE